MMLTGFRQLLRGCHRGARSNSKCVAAKRFALVAATVLLAIRVAPAFADCTYPFLDWTTETQWAKPASLAIGLSGEIYIVGGFDHGTDFDPTGGVQLISPVASNVDEADDLYATRLESDESYGWTYTDGLDEVDSATAVAVGPDGHVVVVGGFRRFLAAGLIADGESDAYVVKLDSAFGQPIWAQSIGGPPNETATSLAIDPVDGSVFVGLDDGSLNKFNSDGTDPLGS